MQVPSLGQEDPLEEGMAAHSSILPGKSQGQRSLQPIGSQEADTTEVTTHAHTWTTRIVIGGTPQRCFNSDCHAAALSPCLESYPI